jgi:putative nucleotidyltransferase with HDIG domain
VDIERTEGASILSAFRAIENEIGVGQEQRACIFVVTALSGRQLETDCLMQGADEFFTKPLEKNRLLGKIRNYDQLSGPAAAGKIPPSTAPVIAAATILDTVNRKLDKGDLNLPPVPKIAMKLRQMIDCNAEIKDVVDLLQQDLAVATKLVSASNSAFYRGVEKNTTLTQATSRLGLDRTRDVVMSICCRGYFSTNHQAYKEMVETLWWHSLACAHTAEMIVEKRGWTVDDDIFSIGLLHDIGKLVVVQVAGELIQRQKGQATVDQDDLFDLMDRQHERLGARVLQKMGYPDTFVSLVKGHHRIDDGEKTPRALMAIQQADLLTKAAGFGLGSDSTETIEEKMQAVGIDGPMKEVALPEIVKCMDQLRYVFG